MRSIRTKFTLITVIAILVAVVTCALIGVVSIRRLGDDDAEQMLHLVCEAGRQHLDHYFESVEQAASTMAVFAEDDLTHTDEAGLADHVERVRDLFRRVSYQTHGVLTYYYRLDPAVAGDVRGFWYAYLTRDGFVEREVTDISAYDTADTSSLVWFSVPKSTGRAVWLSPYETENLGARVVSFNVPVFWNGTFLGVVGIEIDCDTLEREVEDIKLMEHGLGFVTDADGSLLFHPTLDVAARGRDHHAYVPQGLRGTDEHVTYEYEGVRKEAARLPLSNGMYLVVAVPTQEIDARWQRLVIEVGVAAFALLVALGLVSMRFASHITQPLRDLTHAAERVNEGDYDFTVSYEGNDEVGILTKTFESLVDNVRAEIFDLNQRVFVDALTHVRNKAALTRCLRELQETLDAKGEPLAFALGVFDCDNLKQINDKWGHDKGDSYLREASALICQVFDHSPVFRTGGDEFALLLRGQDFDRRDELLEEFARASEAASEAAQHPWEEVHVSVGIVAYDPELDETVDECLRRADRAMYENKRERKCGRA